MVVDTVTQIYLACRKADGVYRVVVLIEAIGRSPEVRRFSNGKVGSPFGAECFGVLRALDMAARCGVRAITLNCSQVLSLEAASDEATKGWTYLAEARRIADCAGIDVSFRKVASRENPALHHLTSESLNR